jgi:hypothetical protein
MTAASQALDDAILAVLREHWPVPCATTTLIGTLAAGGRGRGSDFGVAVYRRLYAMARQQSPTVRTVRLPNHRTAYWRLAQPPDPLPDVLQELDRSLRERG